MSEQPHLMSCTVAIDRWYGGELVTTVLGCWSTAEGNNGTTAYDVLEHVRDALGRRWRPATVGEIQQSIEARRTERTPWEQISLF